MYSETSENWCRQNEVADTADSPSLPFSHAQLGLPGAELGNRVWFAAESFRLGGSTFSCSARTPSECRRPRPFQVADVISPNQGQPTLPPANCGIPHKALTSATSPRASTCHAPRSGSSLEGASPAFPRAGCRSFWPAGLGAVIPFPLPSLDPPSPDYGVYLVPSRSASARRLSRK